MPKKEIKNTKKNSSLDDNIYVKTALAAIAIILILIGGLIGYKIKNSENIKTKETYQATADEKKFKKEYEILNGTMRSNGEVNKEISIIEDNNIEYINVEKAADILKEGSGIIYFGFAACPWSRNAVPILLNAMQSTDLDKIYYVNIRPNDDEYQDIREKYTAVKNKAKKTKEALSPRYDEILNSLSEFLPDYTVVGTNGKTINVGKKNLVSPTVAVVKNGVVLDVHSSTVEGHNKIDGLLPDMTKEATNQLFNRYSSMIANYLEDGCPIDTTC